MVPGSLEGPRALCGGIPWRGIAPSPLPTASSFGLRPSSSSSCPATIFLRFTQWRKARGCVCSSPRRPFVRLLSCWRASSLRPGSPSWAGTGPSPGGVPGGAGRFGRGHPGVGELAMPAGSWHRGCTSGFPAPTRPPWPRRPVGTGRAPKPRVGGSCCYPEPWPVLIAGAASCLRARCLSWRSSGPCPWVSRAPSCGWAGGHAARCQTRHGAVAVPRRAASPGPGDAAPLPPCCGCTTAVGYGTGSGCGRRSNGAPGLVPNRESRPLPRQNWLLAPSPVQGHPGGIALGSWFGWG